MAPCAPAFSLSEGEGRVTLSAQSAPTAQPSRPDAGSALLPVLLFWVIAGVVFLLTASNGEPHRISSGYYIALVAPGLILVRGAGRLLRAAESPPNRPIFYALLLFAAANLASTIVTPNEETIYALIERCILPLLVYFSMVGLVFSQRDVIALIVAIALGALVMFARGLLAYHAEFGIPDLETILWSRYNVARIGGFERATVGNVTHMGSYVVMTLPILIIALVTMVRSNALTSLMSLTIAAGLFNLLIAGSRAGMIVMALMIVAITFSLASRRTLVLIGSVVVLLGAATFTLATAAGNSKLLDRFAPEATGKTDGSISERLDSMIIGWNVFLDNVMFGVGPEMSPYYNIYSIPHQSILHLLSELGLLGGLAFVWLNLVILYAFRNAIIAAAAPDGSSFRLLWLIGPAGWLIVGLVSGIHFNMSMALVWVGMAHAMLALSGARVVPDATERPSLSLSGLYRGLRRT